MDIDFDLFPERTNAFSAQRAELRPRKRMNLQDVHVSELRPQAQDIPASNPIQPRPLRNKLTYSSLLSLYRRRQVSPESVSFPPNMIASHIKSLPRKLPQNWPSCGSLQDQDGRSAPGCDTAVANTGPSQTTLFSDRLYSQQNQTLDTRFRQEHDNSDRLQSKQTKTFANQSRFGYSAPTLTTTLSTVDLPIESNRIQDPAAIGFPSSPLYPRQIRLDRDEASPLAHQEHLFSDFQPETQPYEKSSVRERLRDQQEANFRKGMGAKERRSDSLGRRNFVNTDGSTVGRSKSPEGVIFTPRAVLKPTPTMEPSKKSMQQSRKRNEGNDALESPWYPREEQGQLDFETSATQIVPSSTPPRRANGDFPTFPSFFPTALPKEPVIHGYDTSIVLGQDPSIPEHWKIPSMDFSRLTFSDLLHGRPATSHDISPKQQKRLSVISSNRPISSRSESAKYSSRIMSMGSSLADLKDYVIDPDELDNLSSPVASPDPYSRHASLKPTCVLTSSLSNQCSEGNEAGSPRPSRRKRDAYPHRKDSLGTVLEKSLSIDGRHPDLPSDSSGPREKGPDEKNRHLVSIEVRVNFPYSLFYLLNNK